MLESTVVLKLFENPIVHNNNQTAPSLFPVAIYWITIKDKNLKKYIFIKMHNELYDKS